MKNFRFCYYYIISIICFLGALPLGVLHIMVHLTFSLQLVESSLTSDLIQLMIKNRLVRRPDDPLPSPKLEQPEINEARCDPTEVMLVYEPSSLCRPWMFYTKFLFE